MNKEELRFFVNILFPQWLVKSPLFYENAKPYLPDFTSKLETYLSDNKIDQFNMDWVLNMTSLSIRKKLKKMQEDKDELEFLIWENKVIQTIKQASKEELEYYAVLMYLDLKEHPFAQIPKAKQISNPKSTLKDFLHNPEDENKIPSISEKFKNSRGKEMAIALFLLDSLNVLNYEYNSKTKGRKQLAELLNPNIKMNGVNKFFETNTKNLLELPKEDLEPLKKWFSGL